MTVNDRIDTHKKGDAVTAQLALAADEKGRDKENAGCLSNDQLAAVAMSACTPEEKEQALAHLADCKKCYDALVAISFSIASVERSSSQSRSVTTIRNLTWLGSAFAIAASVVVFFNIREVPRGIEQQGGAPPVPVIEQSFKANEPAVKVMSDSVREKPQAAQKRALPETLSLDEEREMAARPSMTDGDLERWMSDVASACIGKKAARGEWLRLRARGTMATAAVAELERRAQLEKIVELLPESGETPTPQQCSQIFTLLAQQAEWE